MIFRDTFLRYLAPIIYESIESMACSMRCISLPRVNLLFKILTFIRRWLICFITQLVTYSHYLSCYRRKHLTWIKAIFRDTTNNNYTMVTLIKKNSLLKFILMFLLYRNLKNHTAQIKKWIVRIKSNFDRKLVISILSSILRTWKNCFKFY